MLQNENIIKGARTLIKFCAKVDSKSKVLIITDNSTKEVGKYLFDEARKITDNITWLTSEQENMHGAEPSDEIVYAMMKASVIFGATQFSLAHTKARMDATEKGSKYLSLPDYSLEQLASPALEVDFLQWAKAAKRIKILLDKGKRARIKTKRGTDIKLDISDRVANYCPGFCDKPGMLGSPPDIETNIAPVEENSEGILIVDGSIPCKEIGLVKDSIRIEIEKGLIKEINTHIDQGKILKNLLDSNVNPKRKVLAEFGIGLNPKAKLCGRMLEDEGCFGTIHFGFGSNAMIGGRNSVNFHLDFVVKEPNITIDEMQIMEKGNLLI